MRRMGYLNVDFKKLFKEIDSRITSQASITLRSIAQELEVSVEIIEQTVREVIGTSFREYLESKKLAHILKELEERRNGSMAQAYGYPRSERRITIPGATVSYLLHGRGIRKSGFSSSYPLYDLSRGGMAFLSDHPLRPGRRLSLLIDCAELTGTLRLGGHVVYAVAGDIAGYQYRLGVRFKAFEAKRGYNPPESLEILVQLVNVATCYSVGNCSQNLP
jgi:hypothetical protein